MKKAFKIAAFMLTLLLIMPLIAACNKDNDEEDPMFNYYKAGSQDTFSFGKWHSGVSDEVFEIEEESDETYVVYRKFGDNTYAQIQSKVDGQLSDFGYINFELKANKEIMMTAQLLFDTGYYEENGDSRVDRLIGELVFSVGTAKKTYSFKIFDNKRLMLDFVKDVWLFPEPGMGGSEYVGNFTIFNSYFSKELPAASELVNENGNGSSGVVEQKIGNWRNESTWTGYKVTPNSNGEVDINFTNAASWATLSRILTSFDLSHNTLDLSFNNNELLAAGDKYSVSRISFRLRGDKDRIVNDPAGYSYWSYFEADIGTYSLDAEAQDAKESNKNRVDLSFDIINARNTIKKHISEGVRLVMLIESHPDQKYTGTTRNYDGKGSMSVIKVETSRDENKTDVINNTDYVGDSCYTLSSLDGETLDITYDATTIHTNIWHDFTALTSAKDYTFTVKNMGSAEVELRYCFASGSTDSEYITVMLAADEEQTITINLTGGATKVKLFFDSSDSRFGSYAGSHLVISGIGIA